MRSTTGKVERRGDSWSYRFAYTDGNGVRRWTRRSGFANKSDAQRALTAAVAKANTGAVVNNANGTTGDFLAAWLADYLRRGTVKPTSSASVKFHIERHLIPRIGNLPLAKLRPAAISRLYGDLLTDGRIDGEGGLSPKTVRNIAATLHKALGEGVRWGSWPPTRPMGSNFRGGTAHASTCTTRAKWQGFSPTQNGQTIRTTRSGGWFLSWGCAAAKS